VAKKKKSKKPIIESKNPVKGAVKWAAPEFNFYKKGAGWSIAIGLIGLIGGIFLILDGEYFTAAILVLGIIVLYQIGHKKPEKKQYGVDNGGMLIAERFFPSKDFRSFYAIKIRGGIKIYLDPLKFLGVRESMIVPKENSDDVLTVLSQNLPINNKGIEPLADKILRWMKI